MTDDQLTDLRLERLEELQPVVRSTERDVDLLKLEQGTLKGMLAKLDGAMVERDAHVRVSITAVHRRLDQFHELLREVVKADAREEGRAAGEKAGRTDTLKIVGWTVMATIGGSGLVVGLLQLVLHHH